MSDLIALVGGKDVPVKYKVDGRAETVRVRELNIDELPDFASLQDSECGMIEFCADKPKGWAKTITRDSHVEVVDAIDEVNGSFFQGWAARMQKREERMMPGITARKLEAITRAAQAAVKK